MTIIFLPVTPPASIQFAEAPSATPPGLATSLLKQQGSLGRRLSIAALRWNGRHFNPGQPAQCTFFVRAIANEVGINLGVSSRPWDSHLRQPLTPGTVSGLAGLDIYRSTRWVTTVGQLQLGDIVFFKNTYVPPWLTPEQAKTGLTHVGIYVGGGTVIHRPTESSPVERVSVYSREFAVALRLGD